MGIKQLYYDNLRKLPKEYGEVSVGWGYTHDGRADKNPYPHDRRAGKDSYPHDSMWLTICVA